MKSLWLLIWLLAQPAESPEPESHAEQTRPATATGSEPGASEAAGSTPGLGETTTPAPSPVSLIEKAQQHKDRSEFDQAREAADAAIEADPEFGPLYLFRGELLAEMAAAVSGLERSRLLTEAAADLERYIARSGGGGAHAQLLVERDLLLAEAERERREALAVSETQDPTDAQPPVVQPEEPTPVGEEGSPAATDRRRRDVVVPIGLASAALVGATAAVFGGSSMVIERACDPLCSVEAVPRPAPLSVAVVGSAAATGLAVWTSLRWSKRATAGQRRNLAIVTGALGGAAAIGTIVTASLAGARWGTVVPSNSTDLTAVQRLVNASVATGVFIAPLLSSSIVAAIPRRGGRSATARR